jgi:hypothetical protein
MTTQEPEVERLEEGRNKAVVGTIPEQPAPQEKRSLSSALLGSALYLAFFTGMTLFNYLSDTYPEKLAFLPPFVWAIITPVTTVAYLLILVYTIRLICRMSLTARLETLAMVTALFIFAVINPAVRDVIWGLISGERLEKIFGRLGNIELAPTLSVLVPFFLILTGVYFGQLLARIIREPGLLVPVSIIAGLIDFWGVYWGPVGAWSEQAPAAVSTMATAATAAAATPQHVFADMPQQLQIFSNISPPHNIGIGDFVFLAFFLACAYRLGFSARRTMWGFFFGLLAATLVMALDGAILFGHAISIDYLPGLVFICGGALLANLRAWRLSRQEWVMTGVLAAILLAFIGVTVVRAEMGKPREIAFTLTAASKSELVTAALKRSLADKSPENDIIVLAGTFRYTRIDERPELAVWRVLAIQRATDPSPRNTRQILLSGWQEKSGSQEWHVEGKIQSSLDMAYDFLRQNAGDDELTMIRDARGVPPAALALIDEVENITAAGDDGLMLLKIYPDQIQLEGQTGNILKEYDVKEYLMREILDTVSRKSTRYLNFPHKVLSKARSVIQNPGSLAFT